MQLLLHHPLDQRVFKFTRTLELSGRLRLDGVNLNLNREFEILLTTYFEGRTGVHGPISDILQKVPLTIFSNQVCGRFYEDIKSSQMCAGVLTGGKDTCEGGSWELGY